MMTTNGTIGLSSDPLSNFETYSSARAFTGYRPYADAGAPDILWMEGTLEMRYAKGELRVWSPSLDASIAAWQAITPGAGPLQADRAIAANIFNEYHPWPDAAAAAWGAARE